MAAGAQKLTPLLSVERLSDRVIRILGCNPSPYTLQGTNSYLVGQGKRRILIDTSSKNHPEYVKNLKYTLQEYGSTLQEIIITHWHLDHVGAVTEVLTELHGDPVPVSKFKRLSQPDVDISPAKYSFVKDNHVFRSDGVTLRALHTPGHTEDHMILYLEEEKAVFAGDTILGESTSVFEDLHSYMGSLQKILDLKPRVIYPGHGIKINNPEEVVSYYIKHRHDREQQVLAALQKGDGKLMTTLQIVNTVYEDLDEKLIIAACGSATHHLQKLVKDKKVDMVEEDGEKKWRLKDISNL